MKNYRALAVILFLPFAFFSYGTPAHASYDFFASFDGDSGSPSGLFPFMNAIAADIYAYPARHSSGATTCSSGQCGQPTSCSSPSDCHFWTGGFDSEQSGQLNNPLRSGFPNDFIHYSNTNPNYGPTTDLRLCQIVSASERAAAGISGTDPTVAMDRETSTSLASGYDNNSAAFVTNSEPWGWDLIESDIRGASILGDTDGDVAMTGLSCKSSAGPAQSILVNGQPSAHITKGQSANLTWADNDIYGAAQQTCALTNDNPSDPGNKGAVLPAALPVPGEFECDTGFRNLTKDGDDGQTSTLMSVPRAPDDNPIYKYGCNNDDGSSRFPGNCSVTGGAGCHRNGDGDIYCDWQVSCEVAHSDYANVSVSPSKTTTYTYDCKNLEGETKQQATLYVDDGGDTLVPSCSVTPNPADAGQTVTWSAAATTGGTPPYTYLWSGTAQGLAGKTTQTVQGSYSAGNYTGSVQVTDNSTPTHQVASADCSNLVVNQDNGLTGCTVTDQNPVVGETVTYTAQGGEVPYIWTPSDGQGSYGSQATAKRTFVDSDAGKTFGMEVASEGDSKSCPNVTVQPKGDCGGGMSGDLTANPLRVLQGDTTALTATAKGVQQGQTCHVFSTPSGYDSGGFTGDDKCDVNWAGPNNNPTVNVQTTYTLQCASSNLDTATVDVVPYIEEF